MNVYFFDQTGNCIGCMTADGDAIEMQPKIRLQYAAMEKQNVAHHAFSAMEYQAAQICWHEGQLTERVGCPAALDVTVPNIATLSRLPVPCDIVVNGTRYPCTDTDAEIDIAYSGKYNIVVQATPYLEATFTIEVP